jgi:LacI family transcriptional regulator
MSLRRIAEDLGVSVATVSNVMSGKGRVSEPLAERISSHATKIGYRPSAAALALKTGRSGIIGFVMPDITHPLFPQFAQGVESAADGLGLGVLIADSRGEAAGQIAAIARLVSRGVDGLIVVPQRGTTIAPQKLPLVVINSASDPSNTVSADHAQGGALAAQAIAALGHQSVLLLGGHRRSEVQRDRIAAMSQGLQGRAKTETVWLEYGDLDLKGYVARGVTAVLAASDLFALQILSDAAGLGIPCPEALSVLGFDNLPFGAIMHPSLATIAPDVAEVSRRAVAYLHSAINGKTPPLRPELVAMSFIKRGSIGPARH